MLHLFFWFRHILWIIGMAAPLCGLWWAVMIFQKEAEANSLPPHHPKQRNPVSLRGQKHSNMHYCVLYQILACTTSWTGFKSSPSLLCAAEFQLQAIHLLWSTCALLPYAMITVGKFFFTSLMLMILAPFCTSEWECIFASGSPLWWMVVCRLWAPGCSYIILLKGVLSFSL